MKIKLSWDVRLDLHRNRMFLVSITRRVAPSDYCGSSADSDSDGTCVGLILNFIWF